MIVLEKELLNTSKIDLSAAQTLYNSEHFSNAIFMLQQSVEKCIKSYGITIQIINETDLVNKINHKAHKIFIKEVKAKLEKLQKYKKTSILIPDFIPLHQKRMKNEDDKINALEKLYNKIKFVQLKDIENLTESELKKFIDSAKNFRIKEIENVEELLIQIKEDWIETNKHFLEYFKEIFSEEEQFDICKYINYCIENADFFAQKRFASHKYELEKEQITNKLIFVWFNLAIITTPHEQKSRYPSSSLNKSLDELYNSDHILIKYFPDLIYLMEKTIEQYEKFYFAN